MFQVFSLTKTKQEQQCIEIEKDAENITSTTNSTKNNHEGTIASVLESTGNTLEKDARSPAAKSQSTEEEEEEEGNGDDDNDDTSMGELTIFQNVVALTRKSI